ncbi:uncharacterized protein BO95DRAFT_436999 [Aspergillus brunneoviolaceus CBS 621.78]|uniref:Uncharacterized protein n=1 Tax=Aspergillus brunneoviolaceus CBS 621.78 TaxID=1450534 RepID=A0ACD1FT40_9EURO|nr:hypothetical protein BO95DRAFT_436999 [Aspergillus brunneoviolaceus CBS 621.78]RAH40080.1 hypothetical protein BO95DRAFT_436999 [Aspergillus brunneoviolaceus CBS 621.78]
MGSQNSLDIPSSLSTVQVSIIDITYAPFVPTWQSMGPRIKGLGKRTALTYSFLVHHTDAFGRGEMGGDMRVDKCVEDIMKEHGVARNTVDAIIRSHAHIDHVGRPSRFSFRTKLVVGSGIKEAFYPGLPAVKAAPVVVREFLGRKVEGLTPSQFDLEIGGLKALDYFGDGNLYLLSAPGHALGHLKALSRTTEDTFIYLAGRR